MGGSEAGVVGRYELLSVASESVLLRRAGRSIIEGSPYEDGGGWGCASACECV